jgi:hypothetical protein
MNGMLVVETVAKIRRAYFVQGKVIKAICRELNVSRTVVRKVLRSEATEFRYRREEQPMPRLGPWQEALDRLLVSNEGKPRRERLTLIRVFDRPRKPCRRSGSEVAGPCRRTISCHLASKTASASALTVAIKRRPNSPPYA